MIRFSTCVLSPQSLYVEVLYPGPTTIEQNIICRFILRRREPSMERITLSASDGLIGLPAGGIQVCNFATIKDAREHAKEHGIEIA
jgi:hypothetical protein